MAFLFPGQGSQHPGALADLFVTFPELREYLTLGQEWTDPLFPPTAFDPATELAQQRRIRDTRVAQPVLGIGGLRLLQALGFNIQTYHMNEGHAALLALDLLRRYPRPRDQVGPHEIKYDVAAVRRVVTEEITSFLAARRSSEVTPTVVALRTMATGVVDAELARLRARLPDLPPETAGEIELAVRRFVVMSLVLLGSSRDSIRGTMNIVENWGAVERVALWQDWLEPVIPRFQLPTGVCYRVHQVTTSSISFGIFPTPSLYNPTLQQGGDSKCRRRSDSPPAANCHPSRSVSKVFLTVAIISVTRFLHRRTFLLHFAPACVREHHA